MQFLEFSWGCERQQDFNYELADPLVKTSLCLFKELAHLPPVCLSRAIKPGKWKEGEPWWKRAEMSLYEDAHLHCLHPRLEMNRMGLVHANQPSRVFFPPRFNSAVHLRCLSRNITLLLWKLYETEALAVSALKLHYAIFACRWPQIACVWNLRTSIPRNLL